MAYEKTNWVNDSLPAINAENLNKIENGIAESNIFRNLFNKNVIGYNLSGASKSIVNEAIRITSLKNSTNAAVAYLIPFGRKELLGKTITLSGSWVSSANKSGRMYIGASDENFTNRHSYIALKNSGESVTVTLPTLFADNNVRFFLALYACYDENIAIDDYVDYTNVKIEENTEATEYTPFAGYIVESGSNDNGSWVKFSDGTMICSMSKNVYVNFSSIQKWGIMWESDNIDLGNFPQTFIKKPYVTISNFSESGGFIEILRDTTTSFVGNTKIARPADTNTTIEYTLSIIAIGRWK